MVEKIVTLQMQNGYPSIQFNIHQQGRLLRHAEFELDYLEVSTSLRVLN